MKYAQSRQELIQHFLDQMGFLRESSAAYDQGRRSEFKRLSVCLRVLLYDGGRNSHSLLGQLGYLQSWKFLDTAGGFDGHNSVSQNMLTCLSLDLEGDDHLWEPILDRYTQGPRRSAELARDMAVNGHEPPRRRGELLDFNTWWTETVVSDGRNSTFSREAIVKAVAMRDGGAHVDPSIDEDEHFLSRENSMGWFGGSASSAFNDNPLMASIRQIAYEVEMTAAREAGFGGTLHLGA